MRIYLVRHGESLGNVDKSTHLNTADHAIPLSPDGHKQAKKTAKFLVDHFYDGMHFLKPGDRSREKLIRERHGDQSLSKAVFRVWTSPYERCRQTARYIADAFDSQGDAGWRVDLREHILLCEQQFGLFDGIPTEELPKQYPNEHAYYKKLEDAAGRFWARMPLGESRFDVATRVHQAFGTFHRDRDRHGIQNIVVVCHGVTMRAFVMMWLHLPFEWVDEEPNPPNCAIRLIQDGVDKGYLGPF